MSSRLQTKIQDIKGMPGKYKRVLLAFASVADDAGTNIYAAKETIADKAGIARFTVYRNLDILVAAGVMMVAESHTCKNAKCPKNGRHFTGRGRYTVAYEIKVSTLQNVTELCKLVTSHFETSTCHILNIPRVSKGDATLSYDSVPPEGVDSSAPDGAGVSKSVSERVVSPSAQPVTQVKLTKAESDLFLAIKPVGTGELSPEDQSALQFVLIVCASAEICPYDLLRWNRKHKTGALYIRTPKQFAAAVMSKDGEYVLLNSYRLHIALECKLCYQKTGGARGGHYDCPCPQAEPELIAVGAGFEVEDAN